MKKLRISSKLVLLLLFAALIPLALFGGLALWQVRQATVVAVTTGNARVSLQAAKQIEQYVLHALTVLKATAENINHADLKDWQKERILKNYLNRFDEFNELSIRNLEGQVVATSRLTPHPIGTREQAAFDAVRHNKTYLSPVFIKKDLSPAMLAAVPIKRLAQVHGVLFAELNLLHMWYLVDRIKIGKHGILHVIDAEGSLVATGDGARKKDVFQHKKFEPYAQLANIIKTSGHTFTNPLGTKVLAVGVRLAEPLHWTVVVEQATAEAYALAIRISYLLAIITALFLLAAILIGYYGGKRQLVDPIHVLTEATQELARGNLEYRVDLQSSDEFEQLGHAFNEMATRLKEVQERLIQEERHAMFGRIAAGLAHDLKHPIQAIETSSRLMDKMYQDAEFRKTFRNTVQREFAKINVFLTNLHNLTHEMPYLPVPIKVTDLIHNAVATFEAVAAKKGIHITQQCPTDSIRVQADPTSLNRALANLISNAIDAMQEGGTLTVTAASENDDMAISVADTGSGIEASRLATLFDDFTTTKRRGLGLGLAITKKIVEQHQGKVQVSSERGKGTCFSIHLPHHREAPAA